METVGYIRVSTVVQSTERQLTDVKLDKVFEDKVSAKDAERPALKEALAYVRQGDTFVIHSIDRLARNIQDLRSIVGMLTAKGVKVKFVKENMEFSGDKANPMNTLLLNIMGSFAEFERSIMLDRQREGIALAKSKGAYKGRKPSLSNEQIEEAYNKVQLGIPVAKVARGLKVSRTTLHKDLKAFKLPA